MKLTITLDERTWKQFQLDCAALNATLDAATSYANVEAMRREHSQTAQALWWRVKSGMDKMMDARRNP